MTETAQILILDPDEQTACDCIQAFEKRGWHVDWGRTFAEAWELLQRKYYDIAIIELLLPDTDGIEAWAAIRKLSPSTVGIILTSSVSLHTSVYVLEPGVLAYLQKPLHLISMTDLIGQALHKQQVFQAGRNVERQLAGLSNLLSCVASASDPNIIISQTLTHLQRIFQFDWAVVYLMAEDRISWNQYVQPRLSAGEEELTAPQREFILRRSVEAVKSLQPQHLIQSEDWEPDTEPSTLQQLGLRELVLVPIVGMEEALGVLAVIKGMGRQAALEPADIQLLTSVGQGVALALNRARLAKELEAEAIHDPTTGVFTAAYLERLIEIETARWKRYATPFSLVVIDMANLPSLADTRGPSVPHKLQSVLKFAQSVLRRSDVVARLSDWQVAILLSGTPSEGAQQLVARVTKALQEQLAARYASPAPMILARIIAPSNEVHNLNDLLRLATA